MVRQNERYNTVELKDKIRHLLGHHSRVVHEPFGAKTRLSGILRRLGLRSRTLAHPSLSRGCAHSRTS
eukprot:119218-Amorphochlora_amoeboformis.AAC.1